MEHVHCTTTIRERWNTGKLEYGLVIEKAGASITLPGSPTVRSAPGALEWR
jgi:hypothetical protein